MQKNPNPCYFPMAKRYQLTFPNTRYMKITPFVKAFGSKFIYFCLFMFIVVHASLLDIYITFLSFLVPAGNNMKATLSVSKE